MLVRKAGAFYSVCLLSDESATRQNEKSFDLNITGASRMRGSEVHTANIQHALTDTNSWLPPSLQQPMLLNKETSIQRHFKSYDTNRRVISASDVEENIVCINNNCFPVNLPLVPLTFPLPSAACSLSLPCTNPFVVD